MTDDGYSPRPVAGWYMAVWLASLLLMLIACGGYLVGVTSGRSTLPVDVRLAAEAPPVWATAIVILAITWTIFWSARHSAKRGWLR